MLCLIAGHGLLPRVIFENLNPVCVIGIEDGFDDYNYFRESGVPFEIVKFGEVGKLLRFLERNKASELVFGGYVKKPQISKIRPDLQGLLLFWRLLRLGNKGDNGIFNRLDDFFSNKGFKLLSLQERIPDLFINQGALVGKISGRFSADIEFGQKILLGLSQLDIGQAVVVCNNVVIGVEGTEGTAGLIERCGKYGNDMVLVKGLKQRQNLRFDLPTIGLETIKSLKIHNFSGIAIEAGGTIMLEKQNIIDFANENGVFIYGFAK
jgi:DUF1009 family protein